MTNTTTPAPSPPASSPAADPFDLTGRVIMISGSSGALGTVVVRALSDRGARVVRLDVVAESGTGEPSADPERTLDLVCDVTDPAAVATAFDHALERFGALPDTVLCHAGMVTSHDVRDFPLEEFDAHMRLNVRGVWLLGTEAARRWRAAGTGGLLLLTSSWVQDVPWPGIAPYNASKAAVRSLTQSFARELAADGVRANAVAPGIVAAGMAKRQWDEEPDYRARAQRAIPLGYMQPPQSVADALLFLMSPMASYMTGTILVVDGGASLYPMD